MVAGENPAWGTTNIVIARYIDSMTPLDIRIRILALREELEARHKYGTVKMAKNGKPIPTKQLQDEMFALILKKSRLENEA
jgi:hypothetical protein